jgi:hypothetical protein
MRSSQGRDTLTAPDRGAQIRFGSPPASTGGLAVQVVRVRILPRKNTRKRLNFSVPVKPFARLSKEKHDKPILNQDP